MKRLAIAFGLFLAACGSKSGDTATLQSAPLLNRIIACTLDQTADYQDAFKALNYAIDGIQIDANEQTANMVIRRSDRRPAYRERLLSSHFFAHGTVSRMDSKLRVDWSDGNRVELIKVAQGYQGNVTVNHDLTFNISCQDSVSKPVRETLQCFPITSRHNFQIDKRTYYARRLDINVYDNNDVSLRIITGKNQEASFSFFIEQGTRHIRRNVLHFSWLDQNTDAALNLKHPKYRGEVVLFDGPSLEVECLRRG